MWKDKTTATYVLAASLFVFSGALIYFTFTLARIAVALPGLIAEFQVAEEKMEPIVEEVREIRLLVPDVLDQVNQIEQRVPEIVAEVEQVRLSLPDILDEAAAYREQVPAILAETEAIRDALPAILEEVTLYREEIPTIVAQVEGIQTQIPLILAQIEGIQAQVPLILAQVEAIRTELPQHLDQAERISMNLEGVGQKAGEGAVTGVFTGLIKAPLNIVSSVGGTVLGGTAVDPTDREVIRLAFEDLIEGATTGDVKEWRNPKTGARGSVSAIAITQQEGRKCITARLQALKGKKLVHDQEYLVCQLPDGSWELMNP